MWKQNKGQASFEMLFVALVILILSILALGKWFSINQETKALILFRLETNSLLNKTLEPFHISYANASTQNSTLVITSQISPDFVAKYPEFSTSFKNIACKILNQTNYQHVTLKINNHSFSC
ncbi:MAG: hypothetical protein DRO04_00495 [Candidatus Iainarchaeum archaeon]|uniref:Uncharacterized protein n=1 Tax=Candidatus Iainarchaeum sp. TaxID=3101447 RepID=A0A497JI10_9ARCH|nr:MAG: hypothetical protein DRO04_00495 [Candidatus Diapherotrites archaeon]